MKKTYTPKVKRSIEIENATPTAMEAFANNLQSSNITEQLDLNENANPNDNFKLFMNQFTALLSWPTPRKIEKQKKGFYILAPPPLGIPGHAPVSNNISLIKR